jgi:hypothetical protein
VRHSKLIPYPSVTISVPKEIQQSISIISATLDKFAPVQRHQLVPIVAVVCVETAFLKWIRRSNEDVLSTIFFTILLGSFAWPVWSNLQRVHCRLDDVSERIEALQRSVQALEKTTVICPPAEYVPAVPNAKPVGRQIDARPERPVERPVATDKPVYPSYIPATPEPAKPPAVVENPPPAVVQDPSPVVVDDPSPAVVENTSSTVVENAPLTVVENTPPTVVKKPPPSIPSAPSRVDGIQLEGMDNIIEVPVVETKSSSTEQAVPTTEHSSTHWLPALREIKLRIEQYTEGRIERISHLDQVRVPHCSPENEPYTLLSRARHLIFYHFAAVACASSCLLLHSPLPNLRLLLAI